MLNFVFWNLNRKSLLDHVTDLVVLHDLDFLFLAECSISLSALVSRLSARGKTYYEIAGLAQGLGAISRFGTETLKTQFDSQSLRVSVRRFVRGDQPDILIVIAHLPSQLYSTPASAAMECVTLSRIIGAEENKVGHSRTLVVGDLNVNPFNEGVLATHGLHAVMTKELAFRGSRTVKGTAYPLFYNPMWSHFGDGSGSPGGTYFYERNEAVEYLWNVFDQVLLRPDLATYFKPTELQILTRVGPRSLLKANGQPDAKSGSDHLPLFFRLHI
jgi:hypothetical protein